MAPVTLMVCIGVAPAQLETRAATKRPGVGDGSEGVNASATSRSESVNASATSIRSDGARERVGDVDQIRWRECVG
jgi:hypothetical protein